jgi:hypothetical protein
MIKEILLLKKSHKWGKGKTLYRYLVNDNHKKPKVALVTCMRKLIIRYT